MNLYDNFPDDINTEGPLFVKIDMLAVPLFTESFERRGKRSALVRFADIDNSARVGELIGLEIFIHSDIDTDLPPSRAEERKEGELFFDELAGYAAVVFEYNTDHTVRGMVVAFIDSEMNPLFRIEAGDKEILVPAAEEFIESINTNDKEIIFNIPEGLLDLNP